MRRPRPQPGPILAAALLALVTSSSAPAAEPPPAGRVIPLLQDTHFHRGFVVYDPAPGRKVVRGRLRPNSSAGEPVWGLAQWHSRFSLARAKPDAGRGGVVRFGDPAKAVTFAPRDAGDADLTLAVLASKEYRGRVRRKGEPWPHLLAEQKCPACPPLVRLKRLRLRIEYRLRRGAAAGVAGTTPRLHAAQFLAHMTVQDLNPASRGRGDYLWFGVTLYDNRHRIPAVHVAPDPGTGKFIYNAGGAAYTRRSAHDGGWVGIDRDVLPLVRKGIETAWRKGFLRHSRTLADFRIGEFNIGWELTGPFDVSMQVRNVRLDAEVEPRDRPPPRRTGRATAGGRG